MLDTATKNLIDRARRILVGKIPDPKSQVEHITLALIYKFMSDMDAFNFQITGARKFFAGDFAKFSWDNLIHKGLSGADTVSIYFEALSKIPVNPALPPFFRDIFKNASLPFRDPEILINFLNTIDQFKYDDSENLGDAYEYLLSLLSSQGLMGQFRTPRHIIDFVVAILDPQKNETILDPACGTAGFLISAYKHILKDNTLADGQSSLTPIDKERLARNISGYDISPDMVMLAKVNLFLHDFLQPRVFEYDTLSSDEKWDETADIILANPPVVTPKESTVSYSRFSFNSNKSELLFLDYIAHHLKPTGRAGVLVPESVIYNSKVAYIKTRHILLNNGLIAIISLPAGVFAPYSRVKSSILILNRTLAKNTDHIAYFDIHNDGFKLSRRREPIELNDIPNVLSSVRRFISDLKSAKDTGRFNPEGYVILSRSEIQNDRTISFSVSNYLTDSDADYDRALPFEEVLALTRGSKIPPKDRVPGEYPVIGSSGVIGSHNKFLVKGPTILVSAAGDTGSVSIVEEDCFPTNGCFYATIKDPDTTDFKYLYHILQKLNLKEFTNATSVNNLNRDEIYKHVKIPLPPIREQVKLAAELDSYHKIIDCAKNIIAAYKPIFPIDAAWDAQKLRDIALVNPEYIAPAKTYRDSYFSLINISSIENYTGKLLTAPRFRGNSSPTPTALVLRAGDILLSTYNPQLRAFAYLEEIPDDAFASPALAVIRANSPLISPRFLYSILQSDYVVDRLVSKIANESFHKVNLSEIRDLDIYLPPIEEQENIVNALAREKSLIASLEEVIACFAAKIDSTLSHCLQRGKNDASL
ncbi:MAG: N-6 DNA methylase [Deltaproteobacteria bacterium]|nr:N-6 DNA methylase [Deltaproteobacteria bacterium]